MLLFELGNIELPTKHTSGTMGGFPTDTYSFKSESGNEISLYLYAVLDIAGAPYYFSKVSGDALGIAFENTSVPNDPQGITGTGDQNEILSTVHNIISREIQARRPTYINFGAHESSRQSLYERWIKLIARQFDYSILPESEYYTLQHKQSLGDSKVYLLRKN